MAIELIQWVKRFEGLRVLLVGDLILDRYLYGDAERISPEAPVPVLKTVERREAVGGSGNVAADEILWRHAYCVCNRQCVLNITRMFKRQMIKIKCA